MEVTCSLHRPSIHAGLKIQLQIIVHTHFIVFTILQILKIDPWSGDREQTLDRDDENGCIPAENQVKEEKME